MHTPDIKYFGHLQAAVYASSIVKLSNLWFMVCYVYVSGAEELGGYRHSMRTLVGESRLQIV